MAPYGRDCTCTMQRRLYFALPKSINSLTTGDSVDSDLQRNSFAPTLAHGRWPDWCLSNLTTPSSGPRWVIMKVSGLDIHPFRCD